MSQTFRNVVIPAKDQTELGAVWRYGFVNLCKETGSGIRAKILAGTDQQEFEIETGARFETIDEIKDSIILKNDLAVEVIVTITLGKIRVSNVLTESAASVAIVGTVPVSIAAETRIAPSDGLSIAGDETVPIGALGTEHAPPANAIGAMVSLGSSGIAIGAVRIGSTALPPAANTGLNLPVDGSPLHLPFASPLKFWNSHTGSVKVSVLWIIRS